MEEKSQKQILDHNFDNENEKILNQCVDNDKLNKFDLNEHLFKYLSVMNVSQDENENKKQNYCLRCKLFFSSELSSEHLDHELIDQNKDIQNITVLNNSFDNFEEKFFKTFTNDLNDFDKRFKQRIEKSIENLVTNLNELKKNKVEDLENLMSNHKFNFQRIKKDFFELKYKFTQFYKKNDIFLNLNNKTGNKKLNVIINKNQSSNLDSDLMKINSNNVTQEINNNLLNVSNKNNNNLNTSNTSLYKTFKSNKPTKVNYFENRIVNDIFYLINLDLNKSIGMIGQKFEKFLSKEKDNIKSQADILENIFEEFTSKVNKFQEDFRIRPINEIKESNKLSNMFPDFAHSLNLRLKKYTEILDNLNYTLIDIKNPTSYKKIESLIGNMENDIIYKLSQRNADCINRSKLFIPESDEMDFKNIVDNLDILDYLEYDYKLTKHGRVDNIQENSANINSANNGLLKVKNKENNNFKINFNFNDKNNPELKSKSDNKSNQDLISKNKQMYKMSSEFLLTNENERKAGHLTNVIEIQRNRKKNLSLNLENINFDNNNKFINSTINKNQTQINLLSSDPSSALNDYYNSSTNKLNTNLYDSSNNFSIINNSTSNKSKSFWKNKEDLLKKYLILSLMGTYEEIQEIEEENENPNLNNSKVEKIMQENDYLTSINDPIVAKIVENTNEILIYDKKSFSITKHKVNLKKEIHGIENFLDGSRSIIAMDKIYILGGRDALQQHSLCFEYDYKFNYIKKIQNMINPRAYHTLIFNPRSIRIIAIGGENNKTCEEYDLYKGNWLGLPDLNVPRAYINCYLNKNKSIIYALFGLKGEITKDNFTDTVEILEMDKKEKGWIKIDYINKCDINLKTKYVHVFPIESEKLLIVGNCYSRYNHKTFAIYDLKIDNISKIDSRVIMEIRRKSQNDPALKKLLSDINKSFN